MAYREIIFSSLSSHQQKIFYDIFIRKRHKFTYDEVSNTYYTHLSVSRAVLSSEFDIKRSSSTIKDKQVEQRKKVTHSHTEGHSAVNHWKTVLQQYGRPTDEIIENISNIESNQRRRSIVTAQGTDACSKPVQNGKPASRVLFARRDSGGIEQKHNIYQQDSAKNDRATDLFGNGRDGAAAVSSSRLSYRAPPRQQPSQTIANMYDDLIKRNISKRQASNQENEHGGRRKIHYLDLLNNNAQNHAQPKNTRQKKVSFHRSDETPESPAVDLTCDEKSNAATLPKPVQKHGTKTIIDPSDDIIQRQQKSFIDDAPLSNKLNESTVSINFNQLEGTGHFETTKILALNNEINQLNIQERQHLEQMNAERDRFLSQFDYLCGVYQLHDVNEPCLPGTVTARVEAVIFGFYAQMHKQQMLGQKGTFKYNKQDTTFSMQNIKQMKNNFQQLLYFFFVICADQLATICRCEVEQRVVYTVLHGIYSGSIRYVYNFCETPEGLLRFSYIYVQLTNYKHKIICYEDIIKIINMSSPEIRERKRTLIYLLKHVKTLKQSTETEEVCQQICQYLSSAPASQQHARHERQLSKPAKLEIQGFNQEIMLDLQQQCAFADTFGLLMRSLVQKLCQEDQAVLVEALVNNTEQIRQMVLDRRISGGIRVAELYQFCIDTIRASCRARR